MPRSRRTILRIGIVLSGLGFSGCLEDPESTTETPQTDDDEMPTEIKLWLEEVSLSMSERESIDPIVFSELHNAEQEIIQTAIQEGEYTTQIGEESDAFSSLSDKIESRANEDLEVYLKDSDTYYMVGLVEGDHIIAET
jgi:hypothetical protein